MKQVWRVIFLKNATSRLLRACSSTDGKKLLSPSNRRIENMERENSSSNFCQSWISTNHLFNLKGERGIRRNSILIFSRNSWMTLPLLVLDGSTAAQILYFYRRIPCHRCHHPQRRAHRPQWARKPRAAWQATVPRTCSPRRRTRWPSAS